MRLFVVQPMQQERVMPVSIMPMPVSIVQWGQIYKATFTRNLLTVTVRYVTPEGKIRHMSRLTVGRSPDSIARVLLSELV